MGVPSEIPERWGSDFFWVSRAFKTVGVQRKAFPDLLSSITDNRLAEQVMKMEGLGLAVLVVEGHGNWGPSGHLTTRWGASKWTRASVRKYLWKVQSRGVWVIQTDEEYDTVGTIRALHEWTTKDEHSALVSRSGPRSQLGVKPSNTEKQEWFLMGLPKVGPVQARKMIQAFDGIPLAWTVPRAALKAIDGFGKELVDGIWEVFQPGPPDPVDDILEFKGKWRWLSNFYPAPVEWDGATWPTAEHAYQAAKAADVQWRKKILAAKSPQTAKNLGRKVPMSDEQLREWDEVKVDVMRVVVTHKFTQNPELAEKLIETRDARLEEGNTWGDTFWGVCNGAGENRLGEILMEVRAQLQQ